ncbi:hypothetical protein ACTID9_06575 [Brevibacillus fluminis]|uniref:hypothetical protein n=1 Tax=Brevibacillus fluminis TaxID=511487 RepID=UPI003F8B0848
MKYPTIPQLITFIRRDFGEFQEGGLNAKQALSRVRYEYEYLADKSIEFKVTILKCLYEMGLENGFEYTTVLNELKTLHKKGTIDGITNKPEMKKEAVKKFDLEDKHHLSTFATIG